MTIEELLTSEESPLTEEQRHELQNEYFAELSELNKKIRDLENKNKVLYNDFENFESSCNEMIRKTLGCFDTVIAMLENSNNGTHRQRDFYADSIIKYIKNIRAGMKETDRHDFLPF